MELIKKTTILFPPDLYQQLTIIARNRKSSVGELVREACRRQYLQSSPQERLQAVAELSLLSLPVGSPAEMKRESTPRAERLP